MHGKALRRATKPSEPGGGQNFIAWPGSVVLSDQIEISKGMISSPSSFSSSLRKRGQGSGGANPDEFVLGRVLIKPVMSASGG